MNWQGWFISPRLIVLMHSVPHLFRRSAMTLFTLLALFLLSTMILPGTEAEAQDCKAYCETVMKNCHCPVLTICGCKIRGACINECERKKRCASGRGRRDDYC